MKRRFRIKPKYKVIGGFIFVIVFYGGLILVAGNGNANKTAPTITSTGKK